MNLDQKEKPSAAVDESSPKPSLPEEPTSARPENCDASDGPSKGAKDSNCSTGDHLSVDNLSSLCGPCSPGHKLSTEYYRSPPPPRRKSVGVMITLPPDSAEESPISPISKTSIFPRTHSRTNTFGTVVPTDESSNTTANKIPSNLKATD